MSENEVVRPATSPTGDGPRKPGIPKDSTVLVVEDNVSNFVLVARLLGFMGIHCEWKTSGYEVVEYADTLPRLDLILMDIRLPYEDGYGALKKIRASERLKNVPIVAVTAEANQEQMNKARASGFDGFLGKPLDPDKFPDQIKKILTGEPVWEIPYDER
ncbi:MAG: response regulator [Anaerolineales bacterium]|jgi:two-component system cell cycle response regulator DivK|nr:response regulator [Anaerolineales bacterium]